MWRRIATAVGVIGVTIALHEAAHAVVALWTGGRVREIAVGFGPPLLRTQVRSMPVTIRALPLGGYAAVDVEHLPPQQRLWMLVAGPLTNIAVGLPLALGLRRYPIVPLPARGRVGLSGLVGTVSMLAEAADQGLGSVARLAGSINVGLGVMNLLPLFPLDGGHVVMNVMEAQGASMRTRAVFASITAAAFAWLAQAALVGDLRQLRERMAAARPQDGAHPR